MLVWILREGSRLVDHHLRHQKLQDHDKTRARLDKRVVGHAFHDYKTAGIDREPLERWSKKVGWETLLNRAGMTFRKLPDKERTGLGP